MAILKVARLGHPVLRTKAEPISPDVIRSKEFRGFVEDMIETMSEYHGVGLAAPQVHESVRVFVAIIAANRESEGVLTVFCNPVVNKASSKTNKDWEGCLSIPGMVGRVPRASDVLEKYRQAKVLEAATPWRNLIPHHPLYYVDFTDLKKIIERADNWKEIFESIFGSKDILSGRLKEIEAIRNSIAHCRLISESDCAVLRSVVDYLETVLPSGAFERAFGEPTTASSLRETIVAIGAEIDASETRIAGAQDVTEPINWITSSQQWWWDETYLGVPLQEIDDYFSLVSQYRNRKRVPGDGWELKKWMLASKVSEQAGAARKVIANLTS